MRRGEGEVVVHDILFTHGPFYYMGALLATLQILGPLTQHLLLVCK